MALPIEFIELVPEVLNAVQVIQSVVNGTTEANSLASIVRQLDQAIDRLSLVQQAITEVADRLDQVRLATDSHTYTLAKLGSRVNGVIPSAQDNAAATTGYVDTASGETLLSAAIAAASYARFVGSGSFQPYANSGLFVVRGPVDASEVVGDPNDLPTANIASIQATDTLVSWLNREYPLISWAMGAGEDDPSFAFGRDSNTAWVWMCTVSIALFDYLQHYLYTPSSGPPKRSTLGDLAQIEALIPVQY